MQAGLKTALRWIGGLTFFGVIFCVFVVNLTLRDRKDVHPLGLRLFRIMINILGIRLIVHGRRNIPKGRAVVIMGNHQSLFDVFVIPVAIPVLFVGVEAAYHFSMPLWGRIIRKWGNIPVHRREPVLARQGIRTAEQVLASGTSIAILPEGHRTLTGRLGPFKKGGFHLVKNTGADILPFGIHGLFEVNNKTRPLTLKPGNVTVTIGEVMPFCRFGQLSVDGLAAEVRKQILALSRENAGI